MKMRDLITIVTEGYSAETFLRAAEAGWAKPKAGTDARVALDQLMDNPEFRDELGKVRADWLTGEGDSHVGTMHHSKLGISPSLD